MRSANAATVRVSRAVGEARVIDLARANGITSPLRAIPSVALGAIEVTPLELVTAYAPFANGGLRVRPRLVRRIERVDGTLLWSSAVERTPVMDPRDAFQMTSMLRGAGPAAGASRDMGVEGPSPARRALPMTAPTLFVGYTPALVAGFWFATTRLPGDAASGARMPAPAWSGSRRLANAPAWKRLMACGPRHRPETGARRGMVPAPHPRVVPRRAMSRTRSREEHEGPTLRDWVADLDDEIARRIARMLRRWGR